MTAYYMFSKCIYNLLNLQTILTGDSYVWFQRKSIKNKRCGKNTWKKWNKINAWRKRRRKVQSDQWPPNKNENVVSHCSVDCNKKTIKWSQCHMLEESSLLITDLLLAPQSRTIYKEMVENARSRVHWAENTDSAKTNKTVGTRWAHVLSQYRKIYMHTDVGKQLPTQLFDRTNRHYSNKLRYFYCYN